MILCGVCQVMSLVVGLRECLLHIIGPDSKPDGFVWACIVVCSDLALKREQ